MPKETAIIKFYFLKGPNSLRNRNNLKRFLIQLFKKEHTDLAALNYIFCSDSYLLKINRKYLKHNYYTDIITFPLSDTNQPILADVYISLDRIKKNAANFKCPINHELHRVIFHGALHLCGYDDKTAGQIDQVRKKENHYLGLYFS